MNQSSSAKAFIKASDVQSNQRILLDGEPCIVRTKVSRPGGKFGTARVYIVAQRISDDHEVSDIISANHEIQLVDVFQRVALLNEQTLRSGIDLVDIEDLMSKLPYREAANELKLLYFDYVEGSQVLLNSELYELENLSEFGQDIDNLPISIDVGKDHKHYSAEDFVWIVALCRLAWEILPLSRQEIFLNLLECEQTLLLKGFRTETEEEREFDSGIPA